MRKGCSKGKGVNMEQIRAFIAIELPDEIKSGLVHLQNSLKAGQDPIVKWVDLQGIHLTLKFLGNIASDLVPRVTEAMAEAAQGVGPFRLEIGGLGAFPNLHRPRVVWVGVHGDIEQLAALQQRIDHYLVLLDFPIEDRPFSPHLTLGRLRGRTAAGEQRKLGQLIASIKPEATPKFYINTVNLMQSRLTPRGAIYSRLASVRLRDGLSQAVG